MYIENNIIMPKLRNNFAVVFTSNELPKENYDDRAFKFDSHELSGLSSVITEIFIPSHDYMLIGLMGENDPISITFSDDVLNNASKSLSAMAKESQFFNIVVDKLNTDGEPVDRTVFFNCIISAISYVDNLSYAASNNTPHYISFSPTDFDGIEIPEMLNNFLVRFFRNLRINSVNDENLDVKKIVDIVFEKRLEIYF